MLSRKGESGFNSESVVDAYSIAEVLKEASRMLEGAGVPEARREAGSLLSFVLGKDRTFLISHAEDPVLDDSLDRMRGFVERRAAGEPLQYITGVQDFYGREFSVTPDVLIPRPETELLVEAALEVNTSDDPFICDVGTGSGCIAVTLLCEIPKARAVAVDKSAAALEVAKINAAKQAVADRAAFVVSDCFDALVRNEYQFDLIVSNPPYVSESALAGLQREVRDHEPLVALSPGADGLSVIRRLLTDAPAYLKPNGHLLMEIGFDQGEAVRGLVNEAVWSVLEVRPDLQSIPRIVVLEKH
ncbi:MAG TPA: peptide chain release factor N(5)-glutamine methyltransferase [Pyrinomonadaceae bacterium]|nr:peptide chain release factor N(5)-glutamine methyltransferase [Pyrinomonadaceae bacterium]